ncbi:MAG: Na+/H+ antiporter [Acetobacteraceae bacterium]|nr:Na+/H+ antiporter [Acetobacteraceae bacterium]
MPVVEATLALVAACIGFALLARELRLPYAVILVLGGIALAFIPGLPEVRLDPELALAFFLPPLLQGSAYRTDWRSFRSNLREILLLAVGCVLFTALCMGVAARLLLPDLPWAAALAFGAIVAPPDAVAAAAVLQRLHLPRRLVTVLEGESLVNDATALVLYRFAVAAVGAAALAPWQGLWTLLLPAVGGMAIGWAAGRVGTWISARLEDTLLETALSFLACYSSYFAAEALHLSGVIAVVTTGFVLGQASHRVFGSQTRLALRSVWQFAEFILNSLVFILIGLQLNQILGRLEGWSWAALAGIALATAVTLILSRFVWVFAAAGLPRLIPALRRRNPAPPWSMAAVVSWAGMRGVVSLAAALALPFDFPQRDLIVFLAFTAILATLVLQGTSLEWLIRRLGMEVPPHDGGIDPEEAEARHVIAQAALEEIEHRLDDPLEGAIAADLMPEFRGRALHLHRTAGNRGAVAAERAARRRLRLLALEAGRARLMELRRQGRLHEESLARLELELDLEELRIRQVLGDERTEAERQEARRRRRQAVWSD